MKTTLFALSIVFSAFATFAQDSEKQCYYAAKAALENMLNGKEKPSYEKAIFLIENAWYGNQVQDADFDSAIAYHLRNIQHLITANYNEAAIKQKPDLLITKEELVAQYKKALTNWAIYTCMTNPNLKAYHYSYGDPMATDDWKNTQVIHLNNTQQGNCFALASMFKILADRLQSGAKLCTAPSHIYIAHDDEKGVQYNIELGSKYFPGTGAINAITYSTDKSIKNGIAQRELTPQQEITLLLVYLAKGYEHKFNIIADDFIMQCAETALQYDSKNLNALLLKGECLESRLTEQHKTIAQLQDQQDFKDYQNLLAQLYDLGYREMPVEMKNTLIKIYNKEKIEPANTVFEKDRQGNTMRSATVSWGLFDERHNPKATERYGNTLFSTKTMRITAFVSEHKLYNDYNFDPVVFALNIDPLADKYPDLSPYSFVNDSPIMYKDPDGRDIVYFNSIGQEVKRTASAVQFITYVDVGGQYQEAPMPNIIKGYEKPVYQKHDYLIAANTFIFNALPQDKKPANAAGHKLLEGGPGKLDPTLVKAVIWEESKLGTYKGAAPNDGTTDIMQANVWFNDKSNDWGDYKLGLGLTKRGGATPPQSVYAGIRILYMKGLKSDPVKDMKGRIQGYKVSWRGEGWWEAVKRYNGGGNPNYLQEVKGAYDNSVEPKSENYININNAPKAPTK